MIMQNTDREIPCHHRTCIWDPGILMFMTALKKTCSLLITKTPSGRHDENRAVVVCLGHDCYYDAKATTTTTTGTAGGGFRAS